MEVPAGTTGWSMDRPLPEEILPSLEQRLTGTSTHLRIWPSSRSFATWSGSPDGEKALQWSKAENLRVVELGSGRGWLGCTMADNLPGLHLTMTDLPEVIPFLVAALDLYNLSNPNDSCAIELAGGQRFISGFLPPDVDLRTLYRFQSWTGSAWTPRIGWALRPRRQPRSGSARFFQELPTSTCSSGAIYVGTASPPPALPWLFQRLPLQLKPPRTGAATRARGWCLLCGTAPRWSRLTSSVSSSAEVWKCGCCTPPAGPPGTAASFMGSFRPPSCQQQQQRRRPCALWRPTQAAS
mmetsp:Transcript_3367/g.9656  ORF Transcript_3367/g.9656 Transcript_3367/m.9656 type:complete len:296 (+) Transcript_3367:93-980(+)